MSVTWKSQIATGSGSGAWLLTWASDLTNPTYRVFIDGRYHATTRVPSLTVTVREAESVTVEVFDDTVTHPQRAKAAPRLLRWGAVSGAASYRVEQFIDGTWVLIKTVKSDASRLRYTTPALADSVTAHQLRVTSVGVNTNESSPVAVDITNVRHPDPPEEATMAYNNATNKVIFSAPAPDPEAPAAPTITTFTHGTVAEYQPTQTRVKNGDTVSFSATFPAGASKFVLENFELNGNTGVEFNINVTDTSISDTFTVVGSDGNPHNLTAHLKLPSGAPGASKVSTNAGLNHDSTAPVIADVTVDNFPAGQSAIKDAESCDCTSVCSDFTSIVYSDNGTGELTIPSLTVYAATKSVSRLSGGYRETGNNYKIVATKSSNGATTTKYGTVRIGHDTPVVTVGKDSGGTALDRMGTDDGTNGYLDRYAYIIADQVIQPAETPTLATGGGGDWQPASSWSLYDSYSYRRHYRVEDADIVAGGQAANNYTWGACSVKNRALREATTVTTNTAYSLGGFDTRTINMGPISGGDPPYTHTGDIGVPVVDTAKTTVVNISKGGTPAQAYEGNVTEHNDADSSLNNYWTTVAALASESFDDYTQFFHCSDKRFYDSVTAPAGFDCTISEGV